MTFDEGIVVRAADNDDGFTRKRRTTQATPQHSGTDRFTTHWVLASNRKFFRPILLESGVNLHLYTI